MTLGSLTIALLLAVPASAQDSDEFDIEDIEIGDPADTEEGSTEGETEEGEASEEAATEEEADEDLIEEELDPSLFGLEEGDEIDLLGDEEETVEGDADTEAEYRRNERELALLGPDEEVAGWERYLERYPKSVFRTRIEDRIETLMDELFSTSIGREETVDAMDEEINFAQAILLENIDPRNRLQLAFEWGFPTYLGFVADYEAQITRNFSVHGGIRRRFQGMNLEIGPRWAIVKSSRTNTLFTFIGDVRLNLGPLFPAFRPQLAFGKRLGKLDLQAQAGADLEFRSRFVPGLGDRVGVETRVIGGISAFYAASERVGVFAEVGVLMKPAAANGVFEGGTFAFNTVSAGLKFFPTMKARPDARNMEANFGVTVPAGTNWWQFHAGSIAGQFNYYVGQ